MVTYAYSENKVLLLTCLNHGAVFTSGKEEGKRQQKGGVLVRSIVFYFLKKECII